MNREAILWKNINSIPEELTDKIIEVLSMEPNDKLRELDHNLILNKQISEQIPEWIIPDSLSELSSEIDLNFVLEEQEVNDNNSQPSLEEEVVSESDVESMRSFNIAMNRGEIGESSNKRPKREPDLFTSFGKIREDIGDKNPSLNILNLDCVNSPSDRKNKIDKWAAELGLVFLTNPEAYTTAPNAARARLAYMEHKSLGIVNRFIKSTQWTQMNGDILLNVVSGLYTMFLGEDYTGNQEKTLEQERAKASLRLINLQLCDICSLQSFFCPYESNLYKLPQNEYPSLVKQYLAKIPIVGEKASKRFEEEASAATSYSLGFAHKLVNEELAKICELSKKQKKLKRFNKNCCSTFEKPYEYGCKPSYSKKKKYSKKYKPKYTKYKVIREKKKFSPGKYFKPKDKKSEKAKYCPKGKKTCRCWVCNIEGHYANECPNRQTSEKFKLIQIAENYGLEPIENPYEDQQEICLLEQIQLSSSDSELDDTYEESSSEESE
uniref:Coat protein n=3 Tax=Carnation etched ring virus TaxID=10640 RepID=Q5W1F2_CERV|nr:coat protein [Carnation etched ring virus]